ncbi:DUF89 family protein [Methanoplanus sp. FWC-SCC4]|uniref:DUF89 family protein n=1 Tax=Methanochimaera problematica TaxID=2609417 RepID=A0AA97FBB6_9EURY|nr:ARMT1-like domain-containing protein [Methanoplanus sp. FWC-SCC4]WOF15819.1 DUF89 family protein [Methanoplanus sp. FWC-SCC4]
MQITKRCFDCLISRIEYECRLVCDDNDQISKIVDTCCVKLTESVSEKSPSPEISSRIHRLACEMMGENDPYYDIKNKSNIEALSVLAGVDDMLVSFSDCCLASVIGNTLDYGSNEHKVTDNFVDFFNTEFKKGFTVDDTDKIMNLCQRVVYLCDNCGEIVFDKKLIEFLKKSGSYVSVVVKGSPIINDATLIDSIELGMDKIADRVYESTSGISEVGINLNLISEELQKEIDNATIIISKGMANYESLSEYKKSRDLPPVAYLMMVKCEPIAEDIKIPKGSRIAYFSE